MSQDSATPWPKDGTAGKVQPAKRSAPEWANGLQILAVAHTAWKEDRDVREVWEEVGEP